MKRRLKQPVVYGLYALSFALLLGGISLLGITANKMQAEEVTEYVSKGILDYEENAKVVNQETTLIRPYNDDKVSIVKNYYDYKADAEAQEKSLLYYEGTYMQSSGVSYSNGNSFEVVSVLDGTVTDVKEDTTLGNVITIDHSNGIVTTYESVEDIQVKVNDTVKQGQIIAKSSTSNISKDLNNHLYFELIINGESVNPENYYDKAINELGA